MRWVGREGEYEPVIFGISVTVLVGIRLVIDRDVPLFLPCLLRIPLSKPALSVTNARDIVLRGLI